MDRAVSLPPVSHFLSRKEWENACWQRLLDSRSFLASLVTPYERHNLVLRAAVMDRLRLGRSYRLISQELWLSSQTVSAIKKIAKSSGYKSYRQRAKTERKKRKYSAPSRYKTSKKTRPIGRAVRTKYGTIYLP